MTDAAPYEGFRVERDETRLVATITLDVPGKFNRVTMAARDQLGRLFEELAADDAVRTIVVTGAGETFTAGGDVAGFLRADPEKLSRLASSPRRSGALSRSSPSSAATRSGSGSSSRSPATSGSPPPI